MVEVVVGLSCEDKSGGGGHEAPARKGTSENGSRSGMARGKVEKYPRNAVTFIYGLILRLRSQGVPLSR